MLLRSLLALGLSVMMCGFSPAGSPAFAAKKAPSKQAAPPLESLMRVQLVRSAQEGCEPACLEWIAAQGRIDVGAAAQLRKVLDRLGPRKLPVLIHSGGGRDDEAMAIGRLLRARGIDVAVARTTLAVCPRKDAACRKQPPRGTAEPGFAVCASACAFILAGGSRRFVGGAALVGVHRAVLLEQKVMRTYEVTPYRTRSGSIAYKRKLINTKVVSNRQRRAPNKVYDKYEKYFVQMGVGKEVMPLMLKTPHTSIYWLAHEELRATRIATHRMDAGELLLGASAENDGWEVTATAGTAGESSPEKDCRQFAGTALGCAVPLSLGTPAPAAADAAPAKAP